MLVIESILLKELIITNNLFFCEGCVYEDNITCKVALSTLYPSKVHHSVQINHN